MSNKFNFENLEVYKRALAFATELCKIAVKFPHVYGRLRDQLIGAATSVPFNIAEGTGRSTIKDKLVFYRYARASLFESVPILTICSNLKLISDAELIKYRNEAEELSKMISGLARSTK